MSQCSVVVNADDFGLHVAVNRGIVRAHRDGIVTSVSLMACGRAFEDALAQLSVCPDLGVGVHLTLVGEKSVLPHQEIPSLVGSAGDFPRNYFNFAVAWCAARIRKKAVQREMCAQIEKVIQRGIRPTHLDSHQHVHCLPGVWEITLQLARQFDISFVRLPGFESLWADTRRPWIPVLRGGVNVMRRFRRVSDNGHIRFSNDTRGLAWSGRMTEERLKTIFHTLQPGLTEIMVHPGTSDADLHRQYGQWTGFAWEGELSALVDQQVVAMARSGHWQLTHFGRVR